MPLQLGTDFGRNTERPMGLPGRVLASERPEISPDVQLYSAAPNDTSDAADKTGRASSAPSEYPRRDAAVRCGVHSSLGLPIWLLPAPDAAAANWRSGGAAAVLEVVTTRTDVQWASAIHMLAVVLEARRLGTNLGTVNMAIPLEQSSLWAEAAAAGRARVMAGTEGGLLPPDLEIDPDALARPSFPTTSNFQ